MSAAELKEVQSVTIHEPEQLTAKDIRAQVNLVQEVMKAVMQTGTHYGKIPGCGDKPTLLKPGAEKLASTFRLAINPEIEDMSTKDMIRYRIRAQISHQISGAFLGAGVGECSSNEEKYCWRNAVCQEEFDQTPEDRRRMKWKRSYNKTECVQQVRTNPADLANTILKMAKKRALVDGILTVCGASDIFTQDIEDMPEELREKKTEEQGQQTAGPQCPICKGSMNLIPAGVSKTKKDKEGNPLKYGAFWKCTAKDCKGNMRDSDWKKQSAPQQQEMGTYSDHEPEPDLSGLPRDPGQEG